jgi:putative membrane protein
MWIELVLALFAGLIIGTITGLFPSLHVNLISAIALALSVSLLSFASPLAIAIFLVSIATTHIFVNFVPSIFLGAPNEDNTALSILPGHELLLKGQGYSAVIYSIYGCIIGLVLFIIFSPLFYFFLPKIYPYAEKIMPLILITMSFFLIYLEKSNKILAFLIFLLSGFLGLATLNIPITEPLLPLFSGLFGISSLITSISEKEKMPRQKTSPLKSLTIKKKSLFKTIYASAIASPLCSFLPGLGSGQAAVIGSEVAGDLNRKEFLVLMGAIATIVTSLSFITLYSIGKARTGISTAVSKLIELNLANIYWISGAVVIAGIFSFFIAILAARMFSKYLPKINYNHLSISMILILSVISIIFSGWLSLPVLLVSVILGIFCIKSGIRRTHLMGCLIIPALVLYLL